MRFDGQAVALTMGISSPTKTFSANNIKTAPQHQQLKLENEKPPSLEMPRCTRFSQAMKSSGVVTVHEIFELRSRLYTKWIVERVHSVIEVVGRCEWVDGRMIHMSLCELLIVLQ